MNVDETYIYLSIFFFFFFFQKEEEREENEEISLVRLKSVWADQKREVDRWDRKVTLITRTHIRDRYRPTGHEIPDRVSFNYISFIS